MDVQIITQAAQSVACDALIVGAVRNETGSGLLLGKSASTLDKHLEGLIQSCNAAGEFKGNVGELLTLHTTGRLAASRVIVVGLGEAQKLTTRIIRRASAIAARHAQQTGAHQVALAIDHESDNASPEQGKQAQVEGALLGLYTFDIYRQSQKENSKVTKLQLLVEESTRAASEQAMSRACVLAEATNFARTLINEPPNVLSPGELAQRAVIMAKEGGLEYEVLNREQIQELGMGGLLAVSQGSAQPPHFIILRYRGAPDQQQTLALVGKGITFDSGGISIKPAEHMDEMKGDMGGAAAVLGAMQAIAHLKPHLNVTALVPTCENMLSGAAYRPGDIVRLMNGKTIEIVNTDAEGRMILADALSYAAKEGYSPIIDLATLTGGVIIALGYTTTGLFCNDEELTNAILSAGQVAGEKYWPMPLDEEYGEQIQSDIADIKQTGGRPASSITAAKILEHFVGDARWAHLDIAGTSYVESKKPYQEKGGVGVGVRTLAELVCQLAQKGAK